MSLFKKVKELYRFHETTRLLIEVQNSSINSLLTRVYYLEEKVEYLHRELQEALDA